MAGRSPWKGVSGVVAWDPLGQNERSVTLGTIEDLTTPDLILQIGIAPVRIDIVTSIEGKLDAGRVPWSHGMAMGLCGTHRFCRRPKSLN